MRPVFAAGSSTAFHVARQSDPRVIARVLGQVIPVSANPERAQALCRKMSVFRQFPQQPGMSFSEDDCTIQRGLSLLCIRLLTARYQDLCTKLVYAQYSCAPKRDEHGDDTAPITEHGGGHPPENRRRACASSRDHWAVGGAVRRRLDGMTAAEPSGRAMIPAAAVDLVPHVRAG